MPKFTNRLRARDSEIFLRKGLDRRGICGGHGKFAKGSSLPCHTHAYDESITILTGSATCQVQGARYQMAAIQTVRAAR